MVKQQRDKLAELLRKCTNLARHWARSKRRGWSTLSLQANQGLHVRTLFHTLTDMPKEVGVVTLSFTLTRKKAKALVNTLANSQREMDVETLSNTLIQVQALPTSRPYLKG